MPATTVLTPARTRRLNCWPSRRQVGLGCSGGLVDQEHPDWRRVTRSTSRACTPTVRPVTTSRTWPPRQVRPRFMVAQTSLEPTRALDLALLLTLCSRPAAQQQLIQTWGMRGAYTHNWNPYWNTSHLRCLCRGQLQRHGQDSDLRCWRLSAVRSRAYLALGVLPPATRTYNIGQLGLITRWTPVKNLTFSADFTYTHLDQKCTGTVSAPSAAIGKPAAVYELKDQNTYHCCSALSATGNPVRSDHDLTTIPGRQLPGIFLCHDRGRGVIVLWLVQRKTFRTIKILFTHITKQCIISAGSRQIV